MAIFALTTVDNPYSPFRDFSEWLRYDNLKGYGTLSYLARIAHVSDAFTDAENEAEVERAIDEIIQYDFLGLYKKVSEDTKTKDNETIESPILESVETQKEN